MREKRKLTVLSKHDNGRCWEFEVNDCTCGKQPHIEECEHSKGAWVICTCRRESKFVYDRKTQYQCLAETVEDWNAMNPIEEKKEQMPPTTYGRQMESAAIALCNIVQALSCLRGVSTSTKNTIAEHIVSRLIPQAELVFDMLTDDVKRIRAEERIKENRENGKL